MKRAVLGLSGLSVGLGFALAMVTAQTTPKINDKLAFEVASIKPSDPSGGRGRTNFPLSEGERYTPNDGRFTATGQALIRYIAFAFDMNQVPDPQLNALPDWVKNDRFDIDAKIGRPATKDEMRVMVRNLLADRCKLAWHTETRNMPIYELVVVKPGKFGPQMRAHVDEGLPCEDTATTPAPTGGGRGGGQRATTDGYPLGCGDLLGLPGAPEGRTRLGGRNVTMAEFMASVRGGMDRPIVDHTGLSGRYDWWIEYVQDPNTDGVQVASNGRFLDPTGPRLFTAFQEQLGLQLKAVKGDVDFLVFDHVEKPTTN